MSDSSEIGTESAAAVADRKREPLRLASGLAAELFGHARECYPEECCGLVMQASDDQPWSAIRCTNVQNRRFSRGESSLDATRGFWIDEMELDRALRQAEERGEKLVAIYHSHVDAGAYLSLTDAQGFLGPHDEPLWPGVAQFVISVHEGDVQDAAWYEWDASTRRFDGRPVRELL